MRHTRLWAFAIVCVALATLHAQTGQLSGQIVDESGAALPGVRVVVALQATPQITQTTTTDGTGRFRVVNLQPGTYRVEVSLAGFSRVVRTVDVGTGRAAVLRVAMSPQVLTAPPPPPPPPPPPVVEAIPYRPVPPPQAAYRMDIPPKDATGTRQTINTGLAADEAVWHFRSGWNVAALNCLRDVHTPILDAYGQMLLAEDDKLDQTNDALEERFRDMASDELANAGESTSRANVRRAAIRLRETHSTSLYNYFASPPARSHFCNAALAVANDYLAGPEMDFATFAISGLQRYEMAFEQFYEAYERYQEASSDWDRRYGQRYGASQPGWVALYGTPEQQRAAGVAVQGYVPEDTVGVPDTATGALIPVIEVDDSAASTPVVQPLPNDAED